MRRRIDADRLREALMREQARYIMSDHLQSKHTSAGFLLAIAELDSQPDVDAIPLDELRELWIAYQVNHAMLPDDIEKLITAWKKGARP